MHHAEGEAARAHHVTAQLVAGGRADGQALALPGVAERGERWRERRMEMDGGKWRRGWERGRRVQDNTH